MNLNSNLQLKDFQISFRPSAKEMMLMEIECFIFPWDEQDYIEMQRQESFNNWLLEIPEIFPVGMLAFNSIRPELEILRFGIHPRWRKKGLGELMLRELEIFSKRDKIESIWLEVDVYNNPAKSLYLKNGFKEMSRRKGYFRNPFRDALLLKKIL